MRMLLKVSIPVESGNAAARNGSLGSTIAKILDELKPEAAYFAEDGGERTGYIFFDMKDSSQLPSIAGALVSCLQCEHWTVRASHGTRKDLELGTPGIERAVKSYGKAATA